MMDLSIVMFSCFNICSCHMLYWILGLRTSLLTSATSVYKLEWLDYHLNYVGILPSVSGNYRASSKPPCPVSATSQNNGCKIDRGASLMTLFGLFEFRVMAWDWTLETSYAGEVATRQEPSNPINIISGLGDVGAKLETWNLSHFSRAELRVFKIVTQLILSWSPNYLGDLKHFGSWSRKKEVK